MAERHYLLKVLGLSGIPKVFTFGVTLVSFPLLMRSLGPSEYGIVLFIGSTLALFEVLLDLGVSSASGKAIAAVRTHRPALLISEFYIWARLQVLIAVLGFVPMVLLAQLFIEASPSFQNPTVLWVMAAAMMFSLLLNFLRINLNSLLAFKSLAILDTTQSIVTSSGFFVVAIWYPSALGLAYAGLATSVSAFLLAAILLALRFSSWDSAQTSGEDDNENWEGIHSSLRSRVQDSANFLWLRLSTRVFQEGPIIFIGRLLGPEIVGIIGAFRKVSEIASTPYLVIGNALMVRVHEVSSKGTEALQSYWETAIRIGSTALFFGALVFLFATPLAQFLLPDSVRAENLFLILSPLVVSSAMFGMLAPMSDYKGGLLMRNTLLSATSVVQLFLIWIAARTFGETGMVAMFVFVNLSLVVGYACVSHKVLFGSFFPILRMEVTKFFVAVLTATVAICFLRDSIFDMGGGSEVGVGDVAFILISGVAFLLSLLGMLLLTGIWRFYFNVDFFEFSRTRLKT